MPSQQAQPDPGRRVLVAVGCCRAAHRRQEPSSNVVHPHSITSRQLAGNLQSLDRMDDVARLIHAFGSRGKHDHVAWKLDILMDLGRIDEPRVVPFLAGVAADPEEPAEVRLDALGRLREAAIGPDQSTARAVAAAVCLRVLPPPTDDQLRLHAAVVLGDFTELPGVLAALGALAHDTAEPIELRYNAFTSLQRAGPSSTCLALLRTLAVDETLGQSATALLASWGAR